MSAPHAGERGDGPGSGDIGVPFAAVLWFVLQVFSAVAILVGLVFFFMVGNFSPDLMMTSLVFAAFVAPVPALIWGLVLRRYAAKGRRLDAMAHAGLALLAAFSGAPAFVAVYCLALPVIRLYLDPRFDEFGFFFGYALIGAIALLVVFPVLGLIFKWRVPYQGMRKLFPGSGHAQGIIAAWMRRR